MVKLLHILLILPLFAWSQDVKVTAEIDHAEGITGKPLEGTITISHFAKDEVDPKSFRINQHPLDVQLIRQLTISPTTKFLISFYRFYFPAQPPGLYVLPAIDVTIGGKPYQSIPSTYEVFAAKTLPQPQREAIAFLELDAIVKGPMPLYPGQRASFIYEIIFTNNVSLTEETLPLLTAEGMEKIGAPQIENFQRQQKNVQRITQLVEATQAGEYVYGPSFIKGYMYTTNIRGKKIYDSQKLTAHASPVSVSVKAFPTTGKPASFNGAVGNFSFDVSLFSPSEVTMGDPLTLAIAITGAADLDTVSLPQICCQPRWSGLFGTSELPPTVKTQGNTKTFTVEVRPLTTLVEQIPTLEFSYFNPTSESYVSLKSDPIPIKVTPLHPTPSVPPRSKPAPPGTQTIEITGNYPLTATDVRPLPFGTWFSLWILPLALLLLLTQTLFKRFLFMRQKHPEPKTAQAVFEEALKAPEDSSEFYQKLQQALLLRLVERAEISTTSIAPQKLPKQGGAQQVRTFLLKIEKQRFTKEEKVDFSQIISEAQTLFKELQ